MFCSLCRVASLTPLCVHSFLSLVMLVLVLKPHDSASHDLDIETNRIYAIYKPSPLPPLSPPRSALTLLRMVQPKGLRVSHSHKFLGLSVYEVV